MLIILQYCRCLKNYYFELFWAAILIALKGMLGNPTSRCQSEQKFLTADNVSSAAPDLWIRLPVKSNYLSSSVIFTVECREGDMSPAENPNLYVTLGILTTVCLFPSHPLSHFKASSILAKFCKFLRL